MVLSHRTQRPDSLESGKLITQTSILALSRRHTLHRGPVMLRGGVCMCVCVCVWVEATKKPRQVPVPAPAQLDKSLPPTAPLAENSWPEGISSEAKTKKPRPLSPESQGTPLIPSLPPLFHSGDRITSYHVAPRDTHSLILKMTKEVMSARRPCVKCSKDQRMDGWGGGQQPTVEGLGAGAKRGSASRPTHIRDLQTGHPLELPLGTERESVTLRDIVVSA
jgi:hypothetical protein